MTVAKYPRISIALAFFPLFSMLAAAQETREVYTVGPRANISITNPYGSITVKASATRQVVVTTTSHSDAVSFEKEQRGNRIMLRAEFSRRGDGPCRLHRVGAK